MTTTVRTLLRHALAAVMLVGCGGDHPRQASPPPTSASHLLAALPNDGASSGVQLFPAAGDDSSWSVWRRWPDGEVMVYMRDDTTTFRPRNFPDGAQTMPLRILESEGALYLFGYDTVRNIPSGRDPNLVREGIDIYRFDPVSDAAPVRVAEGLALGGLDNLIHARVQGEVITACAVDRCFTLVPGISPATWDATAISGSEFVDVQFEGDEAWALLRSKVDRITGNPLPGAPNYLVGRLSATISSVQALPEDCVPHALLVGAGGPSWSCASTAAELALVLNEDLARMPHQGLMEFGASNMEGRIAWSAVYYLRAMLHLISGYAPRLAAAGAWPGVDTRLREELDALARLGSDDVMGYVSRRYSRDRVPLLFALHLGRIAHLLNDAREVGNSTAASEASLTRLRAELGTLQNTVETPVVQSQAGQSFATLGLRFGSGFWADGANAPYNFLSANALGVLASAAPTTSDLQRAAELLLPLQSLESPGTADLWHYWWARGYNGWVAADQISVNTPNYVGQTGWAHITYRSIDAVALVRLHALTPSAVPKQTIEAIRGLVASGLLLPFVNEELARIGAQAKLQPAVARRYARSAAPWELQAQLWALEALAEPR